MSVKLRKRRVLGTAQRPRLAVFRSNKNISCQLIDDEKGLTIASASSEKGKATISCEIAFKIGEEIATKASENKISVVVFDRGNYIYHGKIKALADGARKAGLQF